MTVMNSKCKISKYQNFKKCQKSTKLLIAYQNVLTYLNIYVSINLFKKILFGINLRMWIVHIIL